MLQPSKRMTSYLSCLYADYLPRIIFLLFWWDLRQLYLCSWWTSLWRTVVMFFYALLLLTAILCAGYGLYLAAEILLSA